MDDISAALPPDILDVVSDPRFHDVAAPVAEWIKQAVRAQSSSIELLRLQAELARQLISTQDQRRELEARIQGAAPDEPRTSIRRAIAQTKRLNRIVRDIANGMAWRALSFDRPRIRQLSMKPQTGALQIASLEHEFELATRHALSSGGLVIVNDLTDFLRFGDFTSVLDGNVEIVEVKSGKASAKDARARRQRARLDAKLRVLQDGQGHTADGSLARMVSAGQADTHWDVIATLLRTSTVSGSAYAQISDCLAVEVFRPLSIVESGRRLLPHNPFQGSRGLYVYDSYRYFQRLASNVAPVSIYPVDVNDRAAILTGSALVVSYFDLDRLVDALSAHGLNVTLPSDDALKVHDRLLPGQVAAHELDTPIVISRPGSPAVLSMPFTPLARIYAEFLSTESFASQIVELIDTAEVESFIFPRFVNENELWN